MRASASKELAAPRRGSGVVSLTGGSSEMGAFVEKVLRKMGSSVVRGSHGLPVRPDRGDVGGVGRRGGGDECRGNPGALGGRARHERRPARGWTSWGEYSSTRGMPCSSRRPPRGRGEAARAAGRVAWIADTSASTRGSRRRSGRPCATSRRGRGLSGRLQGGGTVLQEALLALSS